MLNVGYFSLRGASFGPCLAVAKGTVLELYQIYFEHKRFLLISVFNLYGRPEKMLSIRRSIGRCDYLVLIFGGGTRWSLLKWSDKSQVWDTIQLIDLYTTIYQSVTIQQAESFEGILDSVLLENLARTSSRSTSLVTKEEPPIFRDIMDAKVDPEHGLIAVLIRKKNLLLIAKYPILSHRDSLSAECSSNKLLSDPVILDLRRLGHFETIHFCFMFGYSLPTLALLEEKTPTWSGSFSVTRDSRLVSVVQFDLSDKKMKRIWQVEELPHECFMVSSVPFLQGGGFLVFGWNIILYFRDGSFVDGLSCNDLGDVYLSKWSLRSQDAPISLDGCEVVSEFDSHDTFMKNPVIILRDGAFFELCIPKKGGDSVISLRYCKILIQPSTVSYCGNGLIFLGSHVSPSALLEIIWKNSTELHPEDDELESFFGKSSNKNFVVETIDSRDSLFCIGPIQDLEVFDNIIGSSRKMELIAAVGSRNYGAVIIFRRTVSPSLLTSIRLEDCQQIWNVLCQRKMGERNGSVPLLILSTQRNTIVLSVSDTIDELVDSQFQTSSRTLWVSRVLHDRYIIQVFDEGLRILGNWDSLISLYELPPGDVVTQAFVCDPYVMLHLSSSYLVILKISLDDRVSSSDGNKVAFEQVFSTSHLSIISSCTFSCSYDKSYHDEQRNEMKLDGVISDVSDEEYDSLFATSSVPFEYSFLHPSLRHNYIPPTLELSQHSNRKQEVAIIVHPFVGILSREGFLEIYDVVSKQLCFFNKSLLYFPRILVNDGEKTTRTRGVSRGTFKLDPQDVEVRIYEFPGENERATEASCLWLFVRYRKELLAIYRGNFQLDENDIFTFDFCRVSLYSLDVDSPSVNIENNVIPHLRPFYNLSSHFGVFLTGSVPSIIVLSKGYPQKHEIMIDSGVEYGDILSITNMGDPENNRKLWILDSNGRIHFGEIRETQLESINWAWPVEVFRMNGCVKNVVYHATTGTFGVVVSSIVSMSRLERKRQIFERQKRDERAILGSQAPPEEENNTEFEENEPKNALPIEVEAYELQIYRADTWELVDKFAFKEEEAVLSATFMQVDAYKITEEENNDDKSSRATQQQAEAAISQSSRSIKFKPKECIVIGTGFIKGEDAGTRGRLMLFEVARQEAYTEESGAFSAIQLMLIAEKELKSVVSSIARLEGYICCAVGPKVEIYKLVNESELVCCSFYSGFQLFSTSINTVKQYVFVGDMYKGGYFLFWRDRNKSLNFLGKDFDPVQTLSTEFLILNEFILFVVSDNFGNLHLLEYAGPHEIESRGGEKLLRRGVLHLGTRSSSMIRLRTDWKENNSEDRAGSHIVVLGTWDGGVSS
ncbi:Cleavage and polyadenylation specificity factor subunit 1 [Galdieria sulphuraria]|nr:Cleavage and polyadenylation specificity factor subunit 1 [Galdieria sulphuraria]